MDTNSIISHSELPRKYKGTSESERLGSPDPRSVSPEPPFPEFCISETGDTYVYGLSNAMSDQYQLRGHLLCPIGPLPPQNHSDSAVPCHLTPIPSHSMGSHLQSGHMCLRPRVGLRIPWDYRKRKMKYISDLSSRRPTFLLPLSSGIYSSYLRSLRVTFHAHHAHRRNNVEKEAILALGRWEQCVITL